MSIIYVLIPLSIFVIVLSIYFFVWAVNNDQYDSTENYSKYIIYDETKEDNL